MKEINLVDAIFSKSFHFEAAALCTYGLNLNFFENYLMKLGGLCDCQSICVFTDAGTYDAFIKETIPPRWLNKKYLVCRLKTGGVFHPKLYILASEKRVIAGIGSANLTREGIASNLELLSVFTVTEKDQTWAPFIRDCLAYVKSLAEVTKSKIAIEQIEILNQLCGRCLQGSESPTSIRFVHNLDKPLIETIREIVNPGHVTRIQILSPFYDTHLEPFPVFRQLFPESEFEIYLQQKRSNFPKGSFEDIKHHAALMLFSNVDRYLHGKALFLHTENQVWGFIGSANFTNKALLKHPPHGNYEIGIVGQVDKELAKALLQPTGKMATKVKKIDDVQVNMNNKITPPGGLIDYITEAVLESSYIKISVDSVKLEQAFIPLKLRLIDFDENTHEQNFRKELAIELTPKIREKVPGKLAVQILGHDSKGNLIASNIAWVIELEEKGLDGSRKRFHRIFNDPFELIPVLQEIVKGGNKEELRLFLLKFDVPLDLVLPPRVGSRSGSTESKGNIEGQLPIHHALYFSSKIKDAYEGCLTRLFHKLERHKKNPQVNKLGNFTMIISSLFSLIRYIDNDWLYSRYSILHSVSNDDWGLIRDYYSLLLKNIENTWELVWSRGGYRDAINAKFMAEFSRGKKNDRKSFELVVSVDYGYAFKNVMAYALQTIEHFNRLKRDLRVRTPTSKIIYPHVFPKDIHLQTPFLKSIEGKITATKEALFLNE
jgi:HKD family nuclease